MFCKPPHCNQESKSAAVTCQAALPWHEYLHKTIPATQVIVRLIE